MNVTLKAILICLLLLSIKVGYGQESTLITGSVLSEKGEKLIDGYNIYLLNPLDSTLIKADMFFEPNFSIQTKTLPALVQIRTLSHADTTILVTTAEEANIGQIRLANYSSILDELVVVRNRPLLSSDSEGITLRVEGTLLENSGTALELLSKVSRVKVDNGVVSVMGLGSALIVINDRQLSDHQLLESIQAEDILSVKVITNPSSRYPGDKMAVIEIKTKNANNVAWSAGLNYSVAKGEEWRHKVTPRASFSNGKLSAHLSYSYETNTTLFKELYERDYSETPLSAFINNSVFTRNYLKALHTWNTVVNYTPVASHKFMIQSAGNTRDRRNHITNNSKVLTGSDIRIISSEQEKFYNQLYAYNAFSYDFSNNKESNLHIQYDNSYFKSNGNTNINESGINKYNLQNNEVKINSVSVAVNKHFTNDFFLFFGGQYTGVKNLGENQLANTSNSAINNHNYVYNEKIWAIYAEANKKINQFDFNIGCRIESVYNRAISSANFNKEIREIYFLPFANIGYNLTSNWNVSASYSKKNQRPSYQDMNPAINYIDELSYFQGNPELVPEIRHNIGLKVGYRTMASLGINYTIKDKMLGWFVEQDIQNPLVTKATQVNIDRSDILAMDLVLPYQNSWFLGYLALGINYTVSSYASMDVKELKSPMVYVYSILNFNLPYGFKIGTNIRYFSKGLQNIFYFDSVYRQDLQLQKSVWADRIKLSLSWNDIFHSDKMHTYTQIGDRYIGYSYYHDQSYIQLSISINLKGKKNEPKPKTITSGIQSEINRIKSL